METGSSWWTAIFRSERRRGHAEPARCRVGAPRVLGRRARIVAQVVAVAGPETDTFARSLEFDTGT